MGRGCDYDCWDPPNTPLQLQQVTFSSSLPHRTEFPVYPCSRYQSCSSRLDGLDLSGSARSNEL
jgi:hypothetical protein